MQSALITVQGHSRKSEKRENLGYLYSISTRELSMGSLQSLSHSLPLSNSSLHSLRPNERRKDELLASDREREARGPGCHGSRQLRDKQLHTQYYVYVI